MTTRRATVVGVSVLAIALIGLTAQSGLTAQLRGHARDATALLASARTASSRPAGILLGDGAVEPGHGFARPGVTRAFRFRARASGPAGSAHVYVGAGSTAHLLRAGLYSDREGRPGRLLAAGVVQLTAPGRWVAIRLTGVKLTRGHDYWLAVLGRGGALHYRQRRRSACLSAVSYRSDLRTLGAIWTGKKSGSGCPLSAYVTEAAATEVAPGGANRVQPSSAIPRDCFGREEACGYPGPNDTGANCSALTPSGSLTISKAGERVEGKDIMGTVLVDAPDVTMNNDCVQSNGEELVHENAVTTGPSASHFTISNSTLRGINTTSESIEAAITNDYQNEGDVANKDRMENCGTCIYYAWTVENSYVDNDGLQHLDESMVNHAEDWYISNSTIVANHDTLLNPSKQVAVIFAQVGNDGCNNHETVTNSLLAGGGYIFYFCSHSTGNEGSTIDITGNRFARMICTKGEESDYEGRGGFGCKGNPMGYFEDGEGSGGYFPRGGFFGVVAESEGIYERGVGWEGNYWDDNLEAQPEHAYCPKCG